MKTRMTTDVYIREEACYLEEGAVFVTEDSFIRNNRDLNKCEVLVKMSDSMYISKALKGSSSFAAFNTETNGIKAIHPNSQIIRIKGELVFGM